MFPLLACRGCFLSTLAALPFLAGISQAAPPVITQHPQPASAYEGGSVTFTIAASGTGLGYRWLFNGAEAGHPGTPSLTLSNLTTPSGGMYSVQVFNADGTVTSAAARLTICTPGVDHLWQGRPWARVLRTGDSIPGTASTFGPLTAPFNPLFTLRDRQVHATARGDDNRSTPSEPRNSLVRWREGLLETLVFTNTPMPGGGGSFVYPFYPTEPGEGAVNFAQTSMYEVRDGTVAAVLTPGTPVPGRPGATISGPGSFARRGSGVVISSTIQPGNGAGDTAGLFLLSGTTLSRLADDSTDLPGVMPGYAFRLTEDSVNFDGQTIVFSTMASLNGPGGVYRATPAGVITKLLDTGDLIPGLTNEVATFGDVDVEGGLVFAIVGVKRSGVIQNRLVKFEADGSAQAIAFADFLVAGGPRQVYFGTSGLIQRWTDGVVETVINTQALLDCQRVKSFFDVEAQGEDVAIGVEFHDGSAGIYVNLGEPAPGSVRIVGQPASVTLPETATATFAVAAIGPSPITYQWFKGASAIPGATNAQLVLPGIGPGDAVEYHAVVGSGASSVHSAKARLTLGPPPAKPLLFIPPASVAVPVGSPAVLRAVAAGVGPLNYKWTKGTQVFSDGLAAELAFASVTPADHGTYQVVVSNANGAAPGWTATLSVVPILTEQPQSQTVAAGGAATFRVAATGFPQYRYLWFKGSNPMLNQTNAVLELTNVQPGDAGSYSVQVSAQGAGAVRSTTAQLTVGGGGGAPLALGLPVLAAGRLAFTFPTQPGRNYQVQTRADLVSGSWLAGESIPGDGTLKTASVGVEGAAGWVRVVELP